MALTLQKKLSALLLLISALCFSQQAELLISERGTLKIINASGQVVRGPYTQKYSNTNHIIAFGTNGCVLLDKELNEKLNTGSDTIADVLLDKYPVIVKQGKRGLFDMNKKQIIPCAYDEIDYGRYDNDTVDLYFRVNSGSVRGICNSKGEMLIPVEYDDITNIGEGFWSLKKNDKWAVCDKNAKNITPVKYTSVGQFRNGFLPVQVSDTFGILNKELKESVPVSLTFSVQNFYDGAYAEAAKRKEESFYEEYHGIIDTKGNFIVPMKYNSLSTTPYGFIVNAGDNYDNRQYGLYSLRGESLLKEEYSYIDFDPDQKLFMVKKGDNYALYDGVKFLCPFTATAIKTFKDGIAVFEVGEEKGLINTSGKEILPADYDDIEYNYRNCYTLKKDGRRGLWFANSGKAPELIYERIDKMTKDSFFVAKKDGKYGVLDKKGKPVKDFMYDGLNTNYTVMGHYADDWDQLKYLIENKMLKGPVFAAEKDGKKGYVILGGRDSIPFPFYDHFLYLNGTAIVEHGKNKMILDKTGKVLFSTGEVKDTLLSMGNFFLLLRDKKYKVIDEKGNVGEILYDELPSSDNRSDYYTAQSGGKYYILSSSGEVLIKASPLFINDYSDGLGISSVYGIITDVVNKDGAVIFKGTERSFGGTNMGEMGEELCRLTELEEVYFSGNDSDDNFKLPGCFYSLPKLKKITIRQCNYPKVPDKIIGLRSLHYLELSNGYNLTVSPNLYKLPIDTLIINDRIKMSPLMAGMKKLRHLSVNTNSLIAIPTLESLQLNTEVLPMNLAAFKNLKHLEARIDYKTIPTVAKAKLFLQTLKTLPLEYVSFSGPVIVFSEALLKDPGLIKALKNLKEFRCEFSTDEDVETLQKALPGVKVQRN